VRRGCPLQGAGSRDGTGDQTMSKSGLLECVSCLCILAFSQPRKTCLGVVGSVGQIRVGRTRFAVDPEVENRRSIRVHDGIVEIEEVHLAVLMLAKFGWVDSILSRWRALPFQFYVIAGVTRSLTRSGIAQQKSQTTLEGKKCRHYRLYSTNCSRNSSIMVVSSQIMQIITYVTENDEPWRCLCFAEKSFRYPCTRHSNFQAQIERV
jgi:hypothetical protein